MFGSRHPPVSTIFFRFSGNFGTEGRAFLGWLRNVLDDADVTHILKDKGKINRIIKNHSIALVTFSLKCSVPLCKFYLWAKDVFTVYEGSQWLPVIVEAREKKPVKTNSTIIKNGENEQIACYAPEIPQFFSCYD